MRSCIYFWALFELLDYVTVFWSVASATTSWHCLYLYDSGTYIFILVNSSSQEIRKYDFFLLLVIDIECTLFFKLVVVFLESWVSVIIQNQMII